MSARPVWAEISRSNLLHNFGLLRRLTASAELLAVVKADAYGHGAVACSAVIAEAGARWLGVTGVEEGVAVRAVCQQAEILSMGGLWPGEAETAIEHRITPAVWEPDHLEEAARTGSPVSVHLEVDTGMSRQGVQVAELNSFLQSLQGRPSLRMSGVFTHFHSPELRDCPANEEQFGLFVTSLDTIAGRGMHPHWIHAGNSATLLEPGPAKLVNVAKKHNARPMLRPGLALYGYAPRFSGGKQVAFAADLKPVLAWKSRIVSLRTIEAGKTAGYCATFRATRKTKLALLPLGYADGLNRLLSNRGAALVRGLRAPIAGRISMDLTIVDVTDIPGAEIGDEAVLIGAQGAESITAYDHADIAGTIPYEILCNISARVPRMMVD